MRFLSALEVRSLAEEIHPWFATWVYFAAYTGLRWSEMLRLRRRDIDVATGRVRVERQLTNNAGRLVFGPLRATRAALRARAGRAGVREYDGSLAARLELHLPGVAARET